MERIYYHLSDDTLKGLYVALKRAEDELMNKAPSECMLDWYLSHEYGMQNCNVLAGVWVEMAARGLFYDDNNVVS